ncbi:SusC/RagA family TonB-linked outer membrane protein [Flavicella marina]|uniref:SusC/RagA family TonB-linked outer membrane protein n=1 Tax=Flavicella marina TaxID=1475951 RepID=UPI001263F87F|nr:TonB-dependent receptor [Flavicella marina]
MNKLVKKRKKQYKNNRYSLLLLIMLCTSVFSYAQNSVKEITGVVVDESGTPLMGVNVVTLNNSSGGVTDIDGRFSLNVLSSTTMLKFSFIGFASQNIDIQNKNEINVVLKEDMNVLNEVLLIGYGSVKKEDLTGSVSSVDIGEIQDKPVVRIEQALVGRLAGVEVKSNSGAPGGNTSIRIRGANSIKGNNQPLVVIDGVIGADMQLVSAEDIKSIEVLKDASSTAIYGSRGANGVIIIATKSGEKGDPNISFSTFGSFSTLPKKVDYLSAGEFSELYNAYDKELNFIPGAYEPPFSDQEVQNYYNNGGTNWESELFRVAFTKNYKVGIDGGSDNIDYYLSGEYLDQEGILINSDYERFNLRAKLVIDLSEKLKLNVSLVNSKQKGLNNGDVGHQLGAIGRLPQWVATEPVWEIQDVLYNNTPKYGAVSGNPVGIQMANETTTTTKNFQPSVSLKYQIHPGFSLETQGSLESVNQKITFFENNELLESGEDVISRASVSHKDKERGQFNFILNYSKLFENHFFQATGIYEVGSYIEEGTIASSNGLNSPSLKYYNLGLSESQSVNTYYYDEYYNSFALRLNYSLNNKYLVTATVRRDGVSKFKNDNKYSIFPSAAIAWKLSEEPFIEKLDVFDVLKLRSSFGYSGSHAIGSYATLPYFIQNGESNYSPNGPGTEVVSGLGIGAPGNEDLRWETTRQFDIGLEIGLFDNNLHIEADIYDKKTEDLLIDTTLPSYAGSGTVLRNVGEISNKGFELSVGGTPINKKNFSWNTSFNFSINKNEVLSLGDEDLILPTTRYADSETPITVIKVGEALGAFYGYNYLGVWKSNETSDAAVYGNKPGDAKYEDVDNNGVINSEDLKIIGSAQPDYIYGINNSFKIGVIDFSFLIEGVKGGQTFNGMHQKSIGLFGQSRAFTSPDLFNRWTPKNENTDIPAFSSTSTNIPNSSRWLQDASYFRFRNVNITYNFSSNVCSKIHLSRLQLYVNVENLYTFTTYKGYSPDISSAGRSNGGGSNTDVDKNIDTGAYPIPRTFTLGLKLKL